MYWYPAEGSLYKLFTLRILYLVRLVILLIIMLLKKIHTRLAFARYFRKFNWRLKKLSDDIERNRIVAFLWFRCSICCDESTLRSAMNQRKKATSLNGAHRRIQDAAIIVFLEHANWTEALHGYSQVHRESANNKHNSFVLLYLWKQRFFPFYHEFSHLESHQKLFAKISI